MTFPLHSHRLRRLGAALIFTLIVSSFAQAETPAKLAPDAVLYPRESLTEKQNATDSPSPGSSPSIIIAGVILLAAGAWQ